MKRLLSIALALIVSLQCLPAKGSGGSEWFHFGLTGGVSVNRFGNYEQMKNSMSGWHLGLTSMINLPVFFSLQPAVLYDRVSSRVMAENDGGMSKCTLDAHNISIPIALQWGPDLGFCRMFVEAVPLVDFNVGASYDSRDAGKFLSKAQFGFGAGVGINIWRIQIAGRYNWAFGDWKTVSASNPFRNMTSARRGVTISLAYFFN